MWGWLNSIRGLLFLGALTISIIPLALMIAWVTQNAIDNQFDAVREKHLIVAQNLASSLSRYVEDAVAEFDIITQLSDADLSTDGIAREKSSCRITPAVIENWAWELFEPLPLMFKFSNCRPELRTAPKAEWRYH